MKQRGFIFMLVLALGVLLFCSGVRADNSAGIGYDAFPETFLPALTTNETTDPTSYVVEVPADIISLEPGLVVPDKDIGKTVQTGVYFYFPQLETGQFLYDAHISS